MAPVRIYRSNSSFTEEEKIWIILEYGEMASGSPKVKGQKAMMFQHAGETVRSGID